MGKDRAKHGDTDEGYAALWALLQMEGGQRNSGAFWEHGGS